MPTNDEVLAVIAEDLANGFRDILEESGEQPGFRTHDDFLESQERPITNARRDEDPDSASLVVVPWHYTGTHVGSLLGISPRAGQPRELTIEGVTIVERDSDGRIGRLHRFVNWAQTLQELDVRIYDRPVVDGRTRFPDGFFDVPELRRLVEDGVIQVGQVDP